MSSENKRREQRSSGFSPIIISIMLTGFQYQDMFWVLGSEFKVILTLKL